MDLDQFKIEKFQLGLKLIGEKHKEYFTGVVPIENFFSLAIIYSEPELIKKMELRKDIQDEVNNLFTNIFKS